MSPCLMLPRALSWRFLLLCPLFLFSNAAWALHCDGEVHIFPDPALGPGTPGVYLYNAAEGPRSGPGSLIFFNEKAQIVDCINATAFKESRNLGENPQFAQAFVDRAGTIFASMKTTDNGILPYENNWRWVFLDHFFNPKKNFPDLEYTGFEAAANSPVFNSDALVWPMDLVFLKDTTYVLMLMSQRRRVDLSSEFPKAVLDFAEILDIGLRVVNRKTGGVVAEFSGFDFFTTTSSDWPRYLSGDLRRQIKDPPNVGTLPIGYISSIKEVPGDHWSRALLGKRTFLVSHQLLQTIDLIVWDFEARQSPYFVWRLPGPDAPQALRDAWGPRWTIESDPLMGFSGPLYASVDNLIPRHVLVYEDGRSHRFDRGDGEGCPMSRVVEYHIHLDIDGHGTNRAQLVFSYPRIGEYPPILLPSKKKVKYGDELRDLCGEFWHHFTYQEHSGSAVRTKASTTIVAQHSDGEIFKGDDAPPHVQVLVEVDRSAKIIARWNATVSGNSSEHAHLGASRIQYLELEEFRGGQLLAGSDDTELREGDLVLVNDSEGRSTGLANSAAAVVVFLVASQCLWFLAL